MRVPRPSVRWLWVLTAAALLHLGWVALSRHDSDQRLRRAANERETRQAREYLSRSAPGLRISWFYASRGEIVQGEQSVVCYGVENAAEVTLDPPVERVAPAFNRCFAISPRETTTYTLSAADSAGNAQHASLTVQVQPPPPTILFVQLSESEIRRGQPWMFCYGVRHAAGVRLDPLRMPLEPVERRCLRLFPVRTTDFRLVAWDAIGREDRESFRLIVR